MIRTILSSIIIFAVVWFAVTNASAIRINAFFWNVEVSVALLVFIVFALGFVFGVIRVAPAWFRNYSQARKHANTAEHTAQENQELAERVQDLETQLAQARTAQQKTETAPDSERAE